VLSAAGLLLFFQGMNPDAVVIPDQGSRSLAAVERFVAGLPSAGHSLWPHALLGSVLANTATGESPGFVIRAALLLTAEAVLISGLALSLTAPGFRRRFSRVSGEAGRSMSLPLLRRGGAVRALLEKDILLFVRDPVQLSQLVLLAGLFVMYAANLDRFPFDFSSPLWLGVAVFMNISFSGFVMATLLVRFCFPSISLEGPGLSFVMQIPAARRLLPWSKWLQSFSGVLPLMLVTGIYTTLRLGAGTILLLETAGAVVLLSFALVSINTSLGTIFPRFEDLSAASIASGQGGIIAAFSSMGFVLLMVSALSFTTRAYLVEGFRESAMRGPILLLMAVMIPVTALVTLATMSAAVRSFSRRDF
jgi:hypothetical protein